MSGEAYSVERYSTALSPDRIRVYGEHGNIAVDAPIHPTGPLHPQSAAEAASRPWFFTMSPFGPHIIGLAWERHAVRNSPF